MYRRQYNFLFSFGWLGSIYAADTHNDNDDSFVVWSILLCLKPKTVVIYEILRYMGVSN